MRNIGERVIAILSAKDGVVYSLGEGVYAGHKTPPAELFGDFPWRTNPCIDLDTGQTVWGVECWWEAPETAYRRFPHRKWEWVTVDIDKHRAALAATEAPVNQSLTTGETSDGYHTFNELYEHRHALFLNLMSGIGYETWISKLHHDGTGIEGWFIAGIDLPTGTISYHLPERLWDAATFTGATVMERAPEWDGHTSDDVVSRLYKMVAPYKDLAGKPRD